MRAYATTGSTAYGVAQVLRTCAGVWAAALILGGCLTHRTLTRDDLDSSAGEVRVRSIRMIDGTEVDFRSDPAGYALVRDSMNVRTTVDGSVVKIPIDSAQLEGSTRYPLAREEAVRNLVIACAVVAALLWLTLHPLVYGEWS